MSASVSPAVVGADQWTPAQVSSARLPDGAGDVEATAREDVDGDLSDEVSRAEHLVAIGRRALRLARRSVGLVAIAALWQWSSSRQWWHGNIPTPAAVGEAFADLVRSGQLRTHLSASLGRVTRGLVLGVSAGLLAGVLAGLFRLGEDVIDAPFQALRMIPSLALVPLFIIWFGIGESSKVLLICVGVFGPVYLNTFHGIRGVDARHVEAASSFGLGKVRLALHVLLPGASPQILVGLRQALGVSWFTLIVAEQIKADRGLGYLMTDAQQYMRTDVIFVVLTIYAALGLLCDASVRFLEAKALSWRRAYTAR